MKIVEAVLFNNELELLEARLHEGDGIVDRWIVIEADKTFTGRSKPLHFVEHRDRFAAFADRIWNFAVRTSTLDISPWERESRQRNVLNGFMQAFDPDDLIVLSDGDELTKAECWPEIEGATADGQSVSLHKPTWYYTLTWALPDDGPAVSSYRSKAARVRTLREYQMISDWANDLSFPVVPHSGWHLSCLGGPARLLEKLQSFSHQEINTAEWATYENCRRLIQDGVDCALQRAATLTRTDPAGPEWLVTEGIKKYPWLLTGEDPCTPLS
jgi:beta-1,4-mannosyl-glycoprotein beta-1,4-N-acetylglucosaminyltransferase